MGGIHAARLEIDAQTGEKKHTLIHWIDNQ
jgi:hypothetical protein